jgi:glutamyl-tRNA synthetase
MRMSDDAALTEALIDTLPHIDNGRLILDRLDARRKAQLLAAMPGLKERAKTLAELADSAAYLFVERPVALDEKASAVLDEGAIETLRGAHAALAAIEGEWNAATAEAAIRTFAEGAQVKLGAVAQPLRAALTGRTTSPGVFDVLAVLGREESLGRISDRLGG